MVAGVTGPRGLSATRAVTEARGEGIGSVTIHSRCTEELTAQVIVMKLKTAIQRAVLVSRTKTPPPHPPPPHLPPPSEGLHGKKSSLGLDGCGFRSV